MPPTWYVYLPPMYICVKSTDVNQVSLPELVAQTNMDAQSVSRLREELTKFTNWLEKRTGQYFLSEYINPGPEYADKARG